MPVRTLFALLITLALPLAAEEINLLSYNVRHGVDGQNKAALARQAKIIKDSKAQIVGLQEIDVKCTRSGSIDQVAEFAKLTETTGVFGKFMDFGGGEYGMAMLSTLPVIHRDVVRLPAGREPRVAIVLVVNTPEDQQLQVVNVHFDWTTEKLRTPQVKTLLKHLDKRDLPTIVLGDYNAEPKSETLKLFAAAGFRFVEKPASNRFTWNAKKPTVEIDHFVIRDGGGVRLTAKSIEVLDEPDASDHRPVAAVIQLDK
jgi:endonuclease/exonuclease/phosphatase family metal-dependent hydrolase